MHGYATDYSEVFGTFRKGHFYERPTAYYQLRNLEIDLNNAEKARNRFLIMRKKTTYILLIREYPYQEFGRFTNKRSRSSACL